MVAVEIMLNDWLFNAIMARQILTLNRDYFHLDGGLERRLYELARKHCGNQAGWTISMELLHKESGSTASLKELRRKVKMIVESDVLPDCRLRYQPEADQVLFYTKDPKMLAESFGPSPAISVHRTPNFSPSNTDYRSIRHRCFGPSDTGTKNLAGISSAFPTYPYPLTRARDLNHLSNVLTPNRSPE